MAHFSQSSHHIPSFVVRSASDKLKCNRIGWYGGSIAISRIVLVLQSERGTLKWLKYCTLNSNWTTVFLRVRQAKSLRINSIFPGRTDTPWSQDTSSLSTSIPLHLHKLPLVYFRRVRSIEGRVRHGNARSTRWNQQTEIKMCLHLSTINTNRNWSNVLCSVQETKMNGDENKTEINDLLHRLYFISTNFFHVRTHICYSTYFKM